MSEVTQQQLCYLQWHWGTAYEVTADERGGWRAVRRDDGVPLDAESADELLRVIHEDYRARPVEKRQE